jgi:hypothetical protein
MNVPLSNYALHHGGSAAPLLTSLTDDVPLAHNAEAVAVGGVVPIAGAATAEDMTDWIECLSCHRAHGSNAIMTGYALVGNPELDNADLFAIETGSNALLRADNRGVCEQCHNK